jgi:hypothetical protein
MENGVHRVGIDHIGRRNVNPGNLRCRRIQRRARKVHRDGIIAACDQGSTNCLAEKAAAAGNQYLRHNIPLVVE